jgi:hypothetical protein
LKTFARASPDETRPTNHQSKIWLHCLIIQTEEKRDFSEAAENSQPVGFVGIVLGMIDIPRHLPAYPDNQKAARDWGSGLARYSAS